MQGCWQKLLLIVVPAEQLLVYLPVPGGCGGPQPQIYVLWLHRLPDHCHQIVAQSIEVRLVSKLGGEALESLLRVILLAVEAPIYERLNAPSQGVEQCCYQERGGYHGEGGLLAREAAGMLNTTIASAVMASITHAGRPRKSQRPCKVVGGGETFELISLDPRSGEHA